MHGAGKKVIGLSYNDTNGGDGGAEIQRVDRLLTLDATQGPEDRPDALTEAPPKIEPLKLT